VGEIAFDFAHAPAVHVGDGEDAVAHPTGRDTTHRISPLRPMARRRKNVF
jgi:hypothetical protein